MQNLNLHKYLRIADKTRNEYGLNDLESTLFLLSREEKYLSYGLLDIYRKMLNKKSVEDILHPWERSRYYLGDKKDDSFKCGNRYCKAVVRDSSLSAFGVEPGDIIKIDTHKKSKREGLIAFRFKNTKFPIFVIAKKFPEEENYIFAFCDPKISPLRLSYDTVETKIEFLGTIDTDD